MTNLEQWKDYFFNDFTIHELIISELNGCDDGFGCPAKEHCKYWDDDAGEELDHNLGECYDEFKKWANNEYEGY
jgi:hypothetical protein